MRHVNHLHPIDTSDLFYTGKIVENVKTHLSLCGGNLQLNSM